MVSRTERFPLFCGNISEKSMDLVIFVGYWLLRKWLLTWFHRLRKLLCYSLCLWTACGWGIFCLSILQIQTLATSPCKQPTLYFLANRCRLSVSELSRTFLSVLLHPYLLLCSPGTSPLRVRNREYVRYLVLQWKLLLKHVFSSNTYPIKIMDVLMHFYKIKSEVF